MVPNIEGTMGRTIKTINHPRHGTQCVIEYPTKANTASPLKKIYNCVWALLNNSLPKYLRNIESVKTEKFKFELDKFLELIPDRCVQNVQLCKSSNKQ